MNALSTTETSTETWHPEVMLEVLHWIAETQAKPINQLRELADWLEANPTFPPDRYFHGFEIPFYAPLRSESRSAESVVADMAMAARVLKAGQPIGAVQKSASDAFYTLTLTLPHGAMVRVFASRESTCTIVDDGEETVVAYDVPADIKEQYAVTSTVRKTRRVCADLLTIPNFDEGS